jgi:hypothetical protein
MLLSDFKFLENRRNYSYSSPFTSLSYQEKRKSLGILQKLCFCFSGKWEGFDRKVSPLLAEDHVDVKTITFTCVT